ncbi:zf-TFIIB domain-containing protein [Nitratireductor rhodophyticola]|uniref:TFIIB-type zinc ribbon-containing protein n=1 Tax=Nitratireductor rhodophyticola TaxID=2854036 RepID=UPI00300AA1EB
MTQREHDAGLLCPACRVELVMSERQNIEIDYCPKCRGVWLDRGELDKIIERSLSREPERQTESTFQRHGDRDKPGHGHGRHGYRKKSWLHELFD